MNNWQPDVKFEEGVFKFELPNGDEFVIVPPQTKPLSDEEILEVAFKNRIRTDDIESDWGNVILEFARAIEAKVRGEK